MNLLLQRVEGRGGGEGEKREKGGEKPDGMSPQCLPSLIQTVTLLDSQLHTVLKKIM